jgi:hypothetical protein
MDARAWLATFAEELGVAAPSEEEIDRLLALAGVAAHSSERIAAPIACWLAARAGIDPEQALVLAKRIGNEDA